MPIYEYECLDPKKGCAKCRTRFEVIQSMDDTPLSKCPECGRQVRKVISWCRAAIIEMSEEDARIDRKIGEYEKSGMWSHAAELADRHSEKSKDYDTKMRALDNYKKAGYDADSLEKHLDTSDD